VLEVSDVIVSHHPDTLLRVQVRHDAARAVFEAEQNRWALSIVDAIPRDGPFLANRAVDDILVRAHTELQRLHDEFQHPARVLRLLRPLVAACRDAGHRGVLRVVDVGCGLGSVVRTLARDGSLGADVEWLGCDFNSGLVSVAADLARAEGVRCRFEVANALALEVPATILLSTGVVHHFEGPALERFLRAQCHPSTLASVHYDITPTWAAPIGAWLFHMARMRVPLARHDGIRSAHRAHPDAVLASAALGTGRTVAFFERPSPWMPMLRVLRPLVMLQPPVLPPLLRHLGPLASHLDVVGGPT
jgi:2-polyprenyl-3-methyl-5-hydroxy-6-metoxy-1,4-benzoquinol methylase